MATCKIEERDAGRAYPRTCPTCKLGPCRKGHSKALAPTPKENPMTQSNEGNMLAPMWLFDHVAACIRDGKATEEMAQNVECLRGGMEAQAARIAELEARVRQQAGFMEAWKDDLTQMALDAKEQRARAEAAEALLRQHDLIAERRREAVQDRG